MKKCLIVLVTVLFVLYISVSLLMTRPWNEQDVSAAPPPLPVALLPASNSQYKRDSSQPCTFALLRHENLAEHYFPGGGEWKVDNGTYYYQPKVCKFKHRKLSHRFFQKCLINANISSVITIGDSTAQRHFGALLRMIGGCGKIRAEHLLSGGFVPDKSYFEHQLPAKVIEYLKVKFRFCKGCASALSQCKFDKNLVNFEHLAQTMILDNSLSLEFPSSDQAHQVMKDVWALTSQELLFRYYMKNHYPDILLIFLPFVHAKHNIALSRLPAEVNYFKSLVDEYVPNSTKVFYIPAYSEFIHGKPAAWADRAFEGLSASSKINKMNGILYDILEKDFMNPESKRYGFFDMFDVSRSRSEWCIDGVHMLPIYYKIAMSMFWETYCNSVSLDQF